MGVDKLINKRGGHRSVVTRLIDDIDEELNKRDPAHAQQEQLKDESSRQGGILKELDAYILKHIKDSAVNGEIAMF